MAIYQGNKKVSFNTSIIQGIKRDETFTVYTSLEDLNTRKNISVSLVNGEDNTQTLIDVLNEKEYFIDWFSNTAATNKFGIDTTIYGSRINKLVITKTSTDAIVEAHMDSGAILNRTYIGGILSEWFFARRNDVSLVTNSQTFKITIQKNNPAWYGYAKFLYMYGNTLSEVSIGILTTGVSYRIVSGSDNIESVTYTFDDAKNPTIGIKFKLKVYGTQTVTVPIEFGTISSFTSEEFTGDTAATKAENDSLCAKVVEINLADEALQYQQAGYSRISLASYIPASANITRIEGYYIPPAGTSYGTKMPVIVADSGAGKIWFQDGNWTFSAVGSETATGSGIVKLYYV